MKARYPYATIPAIVAQLIARWIKDEGGFTNGKAMGESFATMYGVTTVNASGRGAYGAYIARRVRAGLLTKEEATEYLYEFYYLPYRAHLEPLLRRSSVLAFLLFSSIGMGVGRTGAGAPIDDWFSAVAVALRLPSRGASSVLRKVSELLADGRDVEHEVREWVRVNQDLLVAGMRRSAALQGKPVADGWAARVEGQISLLLAAGKSRAPAKVGASNFQTVVRDPRKRGTHPNRLSEMLARTRGFLFGE